MFLHNPPYFAFCLQCNPTGYDLLVPAFCLFLDQLITIIILKGDKNVGC